MLRINPGMIAKRMVIFVWCGWLLSVSGVVAQEQTAPGRWNDWQRVGVDGGHLR